MGTDICIAVLGRKERDMDYSESMYRAVLLWKKEGGKKKDFCPFYFPYFRNSLLFDWMKTNLLHDGRWNGIQKNIENPDAVKWYFDKKNEDGLRGHSYMTLKEVKKAIRKLESQIKNAEDSTDTDELEAAGEAEDIKSGLRYIYDSAKLMLEADKLIEDRYDFDYDTGNTILLVAFM